jgi:hypothetical protein
MLDETVCVWWHAHAGSMPPAPRHTRGRENDSDHPTRTEIRVRTGRVSDSPSLPA